MMQQQTEIDSLGKLTCLSNYYNLFDLHYNSVALLYQISYAL